jgi:hypothetical protein
MDSRVLWMLIIIAVVAIAALAAWTWQRRQRTTLLKKRFGPEYDRVVHHAGTVSRAEAQLEARAKRVSDLHIRPLTPEARDRYSSEWTRVQSRFVDDPGGAVTEADRLVGEVMNERGYPLGEFEQRVEDISVDHPTVVMNYRATRDIVSRHAAGKASTEDLRQAVVHYRVLFRELLETPETTRHELRDVRAVKEDRELAEERR